MTKVLFSCKGQELMVGHVGSLNDWISQLKNPDTVVVKKLSITIEFDYPLEKPVQKTFDVTQEFGPVPMHWTREQLIRTIVKGYKDIYKNTPDNIWGHGIGDLFIEQVDQLKNGTIRLGMGS